ncbi:hypothetical protein KOAAANKH_00729 [Brevundimonas sp. NIBR10]|uniref:putative entry exclusion protein TrbK-alt n=1 Tax=Brevundimonas sp. NIBR10 TaxID=3015997 RepID=UPI0022F1CCFC|nr:putative entry exclusion protein TrbK-alt [Brevundimonas sp. NIBR10]WGM45864.1 hypothetical protein KOAAANKH_00729 [Brevundimonas sp. NIBR10]
MTSSRIPTLPLGRVTLGLAVLAVVVAGVIAGRSVRDDQAREVRVMTIEPRSPLSETLDRCRLSAAAGEDPACRAAWARSRDRFFSHPAPERADD